MNELLSYIKPLDKAGLEAFALEVGSTVGHLGNVAYRSRTASAALAMQIELVTRGVVSRKALRPRDWFLIWPLMEGAAEAAAAAAAARAIEYAARQSSCGV